MNKKKTLIFIHPHFTLPGGAGKVILELGRRLSKKANVVVIAQKVNPEYISAYPEIKFEDIGGPVTSSVGFWLRLTYWRKKTFAVIDNYRRTGDVAVICNVFPANWIGLPYKKIHPEVSVYWFCHEPSAFIHIKKWRDAITNPFKRIISNLFMPVFSAYDKSLAKLADVIFTNSKFSHANILKIYGRDSVVIYPGVDTNKFKQAKFSDKENYILTVARLTKFKNIDLLIRALPLLKDKEISLKIVGDGEERDGLASLAKDLGVGNRVEILSRVSDSGMSSIYAKAKIFVLCSKEEPFGIVPIEALASGTAVIADNSGGSKETVDDGVDGVLMDNMSTASLVIEIDHLLSDGKRLRELSSGAAAKVAGLFSWDESASKLGEYLLK